MPAGETSSGAESAARQRLWWLVAGRAAVGLALLLTGLLSSRGPLSEALAAGSRGATLAAAALFAFSLACALALRFTRLPLRAQAAAQIFCDVAVVTWLVGAGRDLNSPYVALYVVIISVSSLLLGARGALVTAVGCASSYTSLMLVRASGLAAGSSSFEAATLGEVMTNVGLHDAAFLFVGLLAARLSERPARSDVQLIEATHALEKLRALH